MIDQDLRVKDEPAVTMRIPSPDIVGEKAGDLRPERDIVFEVADLSVRYGANVAVRDVTMKVSANDITALIGPSGCGKSTLIRCLNRMNDLIPGAAVLGKVVY